MHGLIGKKNCDGGSRMSSKLGFTLTQIEYVLAVHRHGHFAKAAKACHVTQPTLSMQVQKLEELLGVTLFDRSKKPILLTDAGKKVIEQFQTILLEAKKIPAILEIQTQGRIQGQISLGIIPTVAPYILPKLLPVMKEEYPGLEVEISEMQTGQIIDALQDDALDVGLLATPLGQAQIVEHALFYEPFYVLCQEEHPMAQMKKVKYSDMKFQDIWLLTEGHCLRHQALDICSLRKSKTAPHQFRFESGSLETLKSLVNSYGGYTLLPQLAVDNTGKKTRVIPFDRPIPAREIGLVYRRRQYKTPLIEALAEAMLKSVPPDIRKIRKKDLDILPVE